MLRAIFIITSLSLPTIVSSAAADTAPEPFHRSTIEHSGWRSIGPAPPTILVTVAAAAKSHTIYVGSLGGTFAQSDDSLGVSLLGSFADPTVLSGTHLTPVRGSFQAVADASSTASYKFTGSYTFIPNDPTHSAPVFFGMDDSNQVSGLAFGLSFGGVALSALAGTVSGNTFRGTASYSYPGNGRGHIFHSPVSGTYSNTASGVTLDGQYSTGDSVVTFSTIGCRAN